MTAPIRYARSGDVNIAYQVTGDGLFDLVLVPGFFSHLEVDWEHPSMARLLDRLGSFARLIRFDKRGTGLSDRTVGLPDFEARMDDVRAVMAPPKANRQRSSVTRKAARCACSSPRRTRSGRGLSSSTGRTQDAVTRTTIMLVSSTTHDLVAGSGIESRTAASTS